MTTRDPNTDPLGEALRSLPRHRAGEGFTERVLDRLGEPAELRARTRAHTRVNRRLWGGLRLAAAGLLFAVGLVVALAAGRVLPGGGPTPAPAEAARQARRESLEAERARLAAELAELRRLTSELAEESAPVLYLGGDEEVDLVLDLGRLARDGYRDPGYRFTTYDQEAH